MKEFPMLKPAQTSVAKRLKLSTDLRLRRLFMVTDEPVKSNLRVGLLLEVLDKLAEETALRYAHRTYPQARVVTAAMADLEVWGTPDVTQDIVLRARINYIGKTSMDVGIRIEQAGGVPIYLGSCYFTMVARVVENGEERSVPLPPLDCSGKVEQTRAEEAVHRRQTHRESSSDEPPTREEYDLLRCLHERQTKQCLASPQPCLLANTLVTSGWERTYPEHENVPQKIFGGYVAHRAYMYAHICAEMVADRRALLVSANRINFHQPVRMGDKLYFESRVTYTGRTSISVETEITRISRDRSMTALSNACIFTFVNVDGELHRLPVPQVHPTTYFEDAKYLAGFRRQRAYTLTGMRRRALQR
jgi:acyl-coenzyme A thioesterase 9